MLLPTKKDQSFSRFHWKYQGNSVERQSLILDDFFLLENYSHKIEKFYAENLFEKTKNGENSGHYLQICKLIEKEIGLCLRCSIIS